MIIDGVQSKGVNPGVPSRQQSDPRDRLRFLLIET